MALALLKIIIDEQLYDYEFVAQWCEGFDQLKQHLARYDLEQLAQEVQISSAEILSVARLYAQSKPAVIISGNALITTATAFRSTAPLPCSWRSLAIWIFPAANSRATHRLSYLAAGLMTTRKYMPCRHRSGHAVQERQYCRNISAQPTKGSPGQYCTVSRCR